MRGVVERGVFKYELLLLLMSIIWGSAFPVQQIGMEGGLGPMTFTGLRFALGCLALVPILIWRKKHVKAPCSLAPPPYKACLGAGLFLFAAAALQQIGLQYTSSANSGFITGLYILFVPVLGMFLGHKAPKILWAGIVVCLKSNLAEANPEKAGELAAQLKAYLLPPPARRPSARATLPCPAN